MMPDDGRAVVLDGAVDAFAIVRDGADDATTSAGGCGASSAHDWFGSRFVEEFGAWWWDGMRLGEFSFMNSHRMEPEHDISEFTRECLWIPEEAEHFFSFSSVIGLTSGKSLNSPCLDQPDSWAIPLSILFTGRGVGSTWKRPRPNCFSCDFSHKSVV
jgi:hypothetical protein